MSSEHSFPIWKFLSMASQGFGLHLQGRSNDGIDLAEQGQAALLDILGSKLNLPHCVHFTAQINWEIGQRDRAFAQLDMEEQHAHERNGRHTLPEVHRLRGEMLISQSDANRTDAEKCFREAVLIAQQQSAKSWELRAATSLAKLLRTQNKPDEARACLTDVYDWFTEGFETADLVDAGNLLTELT